MTKTPKPIGRPPRTLCGLTAAQWAQALGDTSPARVARALRVITGRTGPTMPEVVAVSEATGIEVAVLVAELARRAT